MMTKAQAKLLEFYQHGTVDQEAVYFLEDMLDCYEQAVRLCPSKRIHHELWRGGATGVQYVVHVRGCLCPVYGHCLHPEGATAEILPSSDWLGWRDMGKDQGQELIKQLLDTTNANRFAWRLMPTGVYLRKTPKTVCPECFNDWTLFGTQLNLVEVICPACGEAVKREFYSKRAENRDVPWEQWRKQCNQMMTNPDQVYARK